MKHSLWIAAGVVMLGTVPAASSLMAGKGKGNGQGNGGGDEQNNQKVVLCHVPPGNPGMARTMEVPSPAVGGHLGHGDYLGACAPAQGQ